MDPPLRLSLTISGGASLGAYEAGAAAAIVTAVQALAGEDGTDAAIDAVGGASAGALVALSAAHCLLDGIDPVAVMRAAWVETVSLQRLRDRRLRAPLDVERLRDVIPSLLDPRDDVGRPAHRTGSRQDRPVALHVALTGLAGLSYPIEGVRDRPARGMTFSDWGSFELQPGGGLDQVTEPTGRAPLDFVLASAAHPGAFPPRLLDRREDAELYRRRGIDSLPDSGCLWYTDGGLLQEAPVRQVIAAALRADASERRVHLLIDPRSEDPSGATRWTDPERDPAWHEALQRALEILPAQAVYDDLRRVESENERIAWIDTLADDLAGDLAPGAAGALARAIERAGGEPGDRDDTVALLRQTLYAVAGLTGKRPATVDVISPLVLSEDDSRDVADLLAGELLGDFGGFLSRELRASDFALGYESAVRWLADGLERSGVGADATGRAIDAVERARKEGLDEVHRGRAGVSDVPLRARLELARVVVHAVRVVASDALGGREGLAGPARRLLDRMRSAGGSS